MRDYIVRRLVLMVPTLLTVTIVVFLMIRFIPGNIIEIMAAERAGQLTETESETAIEQLYDSIRAELGLDVPVWTQYWRWIGGIVTRGDFGSSLWTGRPVIEVILERFPVTFELGVLAFIISQLIALPVGIISAIRQDTWLDYLGRSVAIISLATPAFWLATLILVFAAVWWQWSPPMQLIPFTENPLGNLGQFLLPAVLVGTAMSASTMRVLRTTMLETLRQDYVRTAWAKGLRERVVISRHVLKNAMIPVITMLSGQLGVMIGGSVIMEQIFVLPGMGRLFLDSINRRDYSYVSGLNVIFSTVGLVIILLTDLSYAYLDPRIRYR